MLQINLSELKEDELKQLYLCLWGMGLLKQAEIVDEAHKALTGYYVEIGKKF